MNNWKTVKLGEVAISEKGKKPKNLAAERNEEFSIPYVDIKAFENRGIDNYTDGNNCRFCEPDDVLIVWDGARCGLVGRGIKGAIGSTLAKIKSAKHNSSFLFYFLQKHYKIINSNPKGVGIPHIEPNLFWNLNLPLPPLAEQKKIVEKIEELFSGLDSGVASLKKAKEQIKLYRQSVLAAAFSGKLTTKFTKNTENLSELSVLSGLPHGWKWVKLGEVTEVKRGKSKHRPRNAPFLFGGKYPFIQTGEIREANGGTINSFTQTYSEAGLAQSKLWPKGTLCVSIAANIGETAFLGFDACFPDSVVGIIPDDKIVEGKFINYFFMREKQKISELAPATAQKNINVDILMKLQAPLPSLDEQTQIVSEIEKRFSEADNLEKAIDDSLEKSEALRQSILSQAFSGKLV
ncbi:MAG: restriction endonuclease subunit S [Ignavibacteriaceae bacterium]